MKIYLLVSLIVSLVIIATMHAVGVALSWLSKLLYMLWVLIYPGYQTLCTCYGCCIILVIKATVHAVGVALSWLSNLMHMLWVLFYPGY